MVSKYLSNKDKNKIVQFFLANLKNEKPRYGAMKEAASLFNSSHRNITCLWVAAKKQKENDEEIYLTSAKPGATRRKRVSVDIELIQSLELHKRSTIRRLAVRINQSKNTVWRWVNKGLIRAHSSVIKPDLTAPKKFQRLQFSLEALEFDRTMLALKFKAMDNTVHIDEKWFYITKANIFRFGECLFDGKIGIFPLTEQVPAKKNNKNRPVGTLETKEVMKGCFINKDSDPDFRAAATAQGFDIRIVHQPPNSPDANVNDLGWFRAIHSIQTESTCYNCDDLVKAVEESYAQLSPHTLNKVFLSLQSCMVEIVK
ncbi:uncharacterized protein LOC131025786 [Salvia miltiorrhiza]|uniref:uncharacterized protein LOC131025786 n=1 Tax=Salvia miltiorrhiza TaxID=226208 RepID=UPI0025ACECE7|nr:uncharacterized protein LOC131025786 [Salvia miltiorrhiza]